MVTTSIYSSQDTLLKINFLDARIISYYYNNVNKNSLSDIRVIGICYRARLHGQISRRLDHSRRASVFLIKWPRR